MLHKHFYSYEELVHSGGQIAPPHFDRSLGQGSAGMREIRSRHVQKLLLTTFPLKPLFIIAPDPERWFSRFTSKCFQGKFKMCVRRVWWKAADAVIYLSRCQGQITDEKVSGPIIYTKQFLCPPLSVHAVGYVPVITLWVGWWQPVPSAWCFSIIALRSACTHITHNCTE